MEPATEALANLTLDDTVLIQEEMSLNELGKNPLLFSLFFLLLLLFWFLLIIELTIPSHRQVTTPPPSPSSRAAERVRLSI